MEGQWINARPKWEPVENAATCSEEETDNHLDSLNTGNLEDVWNGLGEWGRVSQWKTRLDANPFEVYKSGSTQ